jgi:hypothetical protein
VPVNPGKNITNLRKLGDFESKWLQDRTNCLRLAMESIGETTRSGGKIRQRGEGLSGKGPLDKKYSANQKTTVKSVIHDPWILDN